MDDNDDGARVGLWVVLGIITLLLFGLIGGLVIRSMGSKAPPMAAAAAADAGELVDAPLSGALLVRVLFDLDKSDLHPNAAAAMAPAAAALGAAPGKRLVIAGFHDPSGDPAHNAELAKQRAITVRAAIIAHGADPARVQLRKPEQTALGGPPEEARRVEVRLVD
jgi:outer membrane protein OmpA-like peptidoglycan-associated protein